MTGADGSGPPDVQAAYLNMSIAEFFAALASGRAAPGGGSAAAVSVTLGACLCAMTARLSTRQLSDGVAAELAAEADRISAATAPLIQADAESFQRALAAVRQSAAPDQASGSDQNLTAMALSQATAVPMEVIELAARVARLAARLQAEGNQNLRGDAVTGLLLAQAGARAATVLVEINLAEAPDDDRPARANDLLRQIAELAGAGSC